MMEIMYKDEKKQTEDKKIDILPKNIRQIGEPDQKLRVYLEDFVSTYLQKSQTYKPELTRVCMLYGREKEKNGHPVLFVQSAARVELCGPVSGDGVSEPDWKSAEGIRKKFFPEQKLLGWSVMAGTEGKMTLDQIKAVHKRRFAGNGQILLWFDGTEKEEVLFWGENGQLIKLNGYYIYYEENRSMQEYMISHNPTDMDRVGEPEDQAVKEFRQVVARKHAATGKTAGQIVKIAAAACVVLAIAGGVRVANRQHDVSTENAVSGTEETQWGKSTVNENAASVTSTVTAAQVSSAPEITAGAQKETEQPGIAAGQNTTEGQADTGELTKDTDVSEMTTQTAADVKNTETTDSSLPSEDTTSTASEETVYEDETEDQRTEETATVGYRTYQVKTGDTISSISQRYYGSMAKVREICSLNQIKQQDLIYTGQILLLP